MNRTAQAAGFTLIEVMVVVVIIGLMAAIITQNVLRHSEDAKLTAARVDVSVIYDAGTLFKTKLGRWPDSIDELFTGRPPWLRKKPPAKDPWGNLYTCVPGENSFDWKVVSFGPDGTEGTEDDISSKT